jgi:hypothetical protein
MQSMQCLAITTATAAAAAVAAVATLAAQRPADKSSSTQKQTQIEKNSRMPVAARKSSWATGNGWNETKRLAAASERGQEEIRAIQAFNIRKGH